MNLVRQPRQSGVETLLPCRKLPVKSSTKVRTLTRLCALAGVLALGVVPAAAQDVTTQFWPEIDTFIRLNESMRIYVPISKTREGANDSGQDGTVGIYLDYYASPIANRFLPGPANAPRMHRLLLRLGYSYTAAGDGEPGTNTLNADATWRMTIPWELLLSDRNRFNLNFTGGEFDPIYRNRIQLERHVDLGEKTALNPYVYGEFFYDFDQGDWIKIRATAGIDFQFWERVVPEVYVQRDFNSGSSGDVNGVGLVLKIYLR